MPASCSARQKRLRGARIMPDGSRARAGRGADEDQAEVGAGWSGGGARCSALDGDRWLTCGAPARDEFWLHRSPRVSVHLSPAGKVGCLGRCELVRCNPTEGLAISIDRNPSPDLLRQIDLSQGE